MFKLKFNFFFSVRWVGGGMVVVLDEIKAISAYDYAQVEAEAEYGKYELTLCFHTLNQHLTE